MSGDGLDKALVQTSAELERIARQNSYARWVRFVMAACSGVPWVGGVLGAAATFWAEKEQGKVSELHKMWLEGHSEKLQELEHMVVQIIGAAEGAGIDDTARLESEQYLALVRRGVQIWDAAVTEEKKAAVRRILSNAAATTLVSDDLVRLFLSWVDSYDETHFRVIAELRKSPGQTRQQLWKGIDGREFREDSAEADLFKMLVRDLSTGGVIRQSRERTPEGQFKKAGRSRSGASSSPLVTSAFDDVKEYELTELGKQFVGYAMNEPAPTLGERAAT